VRELDRVSRNLKQIAAKAKEGQRAAESFVGNMTFSYEQQELIRRVFKSILPQIKNARDKTTAEDILERTGWIDG